MVLRRNRHYWKVDEEGKQLPYIDEVTFQKGTSGVRRTMGTMAGSLDHDNVENPEVFVEMMKKAADRIYTSTLNGARNSWPTIWN